MLTVFDWSAEVIAHWVDQGLPRFTGEGLDLFPNERGGRVSEVALGGRFRRYREQLGLDHALDMHSFRSSYATHLIEAGFDALFVQKQLGHEHASTTAIYEFVADDYRRTMLRNALDATIHAALARTRSTRAHPQSACSPRATPPPRSRPCPLRTVAAGTTRLDRRTDRPPAA